MAGVTELGIGEEMRRDSGRRGREDWDRQGRSRQLHGRGAGDREDEDRPGGEVSRGHNLLGDEARPFSHSAVSHGDSEFSGS